jgi:hypothetical protein
MAMKRSNRRSPSRRALGAAVAGILAGASFALGCGQASEAGVGAAAEANGCNGPNGCGSESETDGKGEAGQHAVADANGCNGPNGCNGETQE